MVEVNTVHLAKKPVKTRVGFKMNGCRNLPTAGRHAQPHTHSVMTVWKKSGAIAFVHSKGRPPSLAVIPACVGVRV